MESNLYEAPQTAVSSNVEGMPTMASVGAAFSDAGVLYARQGFISPAVCIKSGEAVDPSARQVKMRVSYVNPIAFLLIFFGLPGWIIIAVLQKSLRMKVYLSEEHAKKYRRNKLIGIGSFLMSVLCFVIGGMQELEILFPIGGLLLVFSIFWALFTNKLVKVIRYKDSFFQLAKVHHDYLKVIPPSPTPSGNVIFSDLAAAPVMKAESHKV